MENQMSMTRTFKRATGKELLTLVTKLKTVTEKWKKDRNISGTDCTFKIVCEDDVKSITFTITNDDVEELSNEQPAKSRLFEQTSQRVQLYS